MERGVVTLAQCHDRRLVCPTICSFMEPDARLVAELPADVAVHVTHRRDGNDPAMVWRLTRLLTQLRPDVVHSHSWGTLVEGLVAARMARVRFLVDGEHGTMETRSWNLAVQRFAWSRADRVLAVSSRLAERLAATARFPRARIQVIRNGVDLGRWGAGDRGRARASLGLADDDMLCGTVGRLVPVKDQATMVQAVAAVRDAGLPVTLLVAGDGPLLGNLQDLAATLGIVGHVRFLGLRSDVEQVLAALDVFVFSSTSEGLSNTLIEAMAAGFRWWPRRSAERTKSLSRGRLAACSAGIARGARGGNRRSARVPLRRVSDGERRSCAGGGPLQRRIDGGALRSDVRGAGGPGEGALMPAAGSCVGPDAPIDDRVAAR